ncbi:MAG: hypothetical protein M3198_04315 [Actinomycetota bacterium]|nr:hypothetical protein [Actinomycetota bacterium]
MRGRVAEQLVRTRLFGPKLRLRVDLHGVSVFGPGDERTLIRWEWIREVSCGDGVVVRSDSAEVHLPSGAFGMDAEELAHHLEEARSIERRPEVIASLAGS